MRMFSTSAAVESTIAGYETQQFGSQFDLWTKPIWSVSKLLSGKFGLLICLDLSVLLSIEHVKWSAQ